MKDFFLFDGGVSVKDFKFSSIETSVYDLVIRVHSGRLSCGVPLYEEAADARKAAAATARVESLLSGLPFPSLYAFQGGRGPAGLYNEVAAVGWLCLFMGDGFVLKDALLYPELEGLGYSSLPSSIRKRLTDAGVRLNVVFCERGAEAARLFLERGLKDWGRV